MALLFAGWLVRIRVYMRVLPMWYIYILLLHQNLLSPPYILRGLMIVDSVVGETHSLTASQQRAMLMRKSSWPSSAGTFMLMMPSAGTL
jgi:hypothetical protein